MNSEGGKMEYKMSMEIVKGCVKFICEEEDVECKMGWEWRG